MMLTTIYLELVNTIDPEGDLISRLNENYIIIDTRVAL